MHMGSQVGSGGLDGERRGRLARIAEERGVSMTVLLEEAVDAAWPPAAPARRVVLTVPAVAPRTDPDCLARRRAAARVLLDAPAMAVPGDWTRLRSRALDPR